MRAMDDSTRRALALTLAAAVAIPAEGIRRFAYYDPPGILTVCRGHTGPDVVKGKKYSLAECDGFLNADMLKAVAIVERCMPGLPSHVLAAFADAVFNMGGTIVCDKPHSTAARKLAAGDIDGACMELFKWNKTRIAGVLVALPGLTSRRALEQTLCLTGNVP
jgi:lysozyme